MQHRKAQRDRLEGLMWLLFSAGGMVAAFALPIHILLNNLAPSFGFARIISYESMSSVLSNPIFKLYFIVLMAAMVYHGMHRVRFVLYELGLKKQHLGIMAFEHIVDALIIIPAIYFILIAP